MERAIYDSISFCFVTANEHPDHDTIAAFRRRFLNQIEVLFVQVLGLAREIGILKLGTAALDGIKIHADACRHSALSYEQASRIEAHALRHLYPEAAGSSNAITPKLRWRRTGC